MRFYTGVEILTGFLYSEYGVPLDTLFYSYQGSTNHDNSYQQRRGWPNANFLIGVTITKKKFEKCLMPGIKPVE
ncbi:hypothetical protein Goshw_010795 [Gossypium schwendimanii]|uniref:Uncharacterized protein n=1 Tax=Gossypium schwendimanii TaxID=34291 RepID=A0A7J9L9Y3_GOSSC|nr:hypothetical protein [Gossypium schwendimanii]